MKTVTLSLLVFSILSFSNITQAASDEECLACHGTQGAPGFVDPKARSGAVHAGIGCRQCHLDVSGYPHGKALRVNCGICHFLGREGAPREQALEYKMSVHGSAVRRGKKEAPLCQTCHGSHVILPSSDPRSVTHKTAIPALCGRCHKDEFARYKKSIHGINLVVNGNPGAASCFDCHLEHNTPAAGDPAWKIGLIRECGSCHQAEMDSYRKTYHGKVTQLGYETAATCSDCHGSHDILSVAAEGSLLSPKNRLATCQGCHPNATENFTKYYAHAEELNRLKYPELFWTYAFMTALLIGVFTFFFTHTFLWAYRSLKERMRRTGGS